VMLSLFEPAHQLTKKTFDAMYYADPEHNKSLFKLAARRAWQTIATDPKFVLPKACLLHLIELVGKKSAKLVDYYHYGITFGPPLQEKPVIKWYEWSKAFDYHFFNTIETQSEAGELRWYAIFIGKILINAGLVYILQQIHP